MSVVLRKSMHTANGVKGCGGAMDTRVEGILPAIGELHNIFDEISKEENSNGSVDYRCIYVHNQTDSVEPVSNLKVKILSQGTTQFELGPLAKNQQAEAITTENTAPQSVTFSDKSRMERSNPDGYLPFSEAVTLSPGESVGLWLKRVTKPSQGSGVLTEDLVLDFTWMS